MAARPNPTSPVTSHVSGYRSPDTLGVRVGNYATSARQWRQVNGRHRPGIRPHQGLRTCRHRPFLLTLSAAPSTSSTMRSSPEPHAGIMRLVRRQTGEIAVKYMRRHVTGLDGFINLFRAVAVLMLTRARLRAHGRGRRRCRRKVLTGRADADTFVVLDEADSWTGRPLT